MSRHGLWFDTAEVPFREAGALEWRRYAVLASQERGRSVGRVSQATAVPAKVFGLTDRDSDTESVNSHHSQLRPRAHFPLDSEVVDESRSRDVEAGSVPSASVADYPSDHDWPQVEEDDCESDQEVSEAGDEEPPTRRSKWRLATSEWRHGGWVSE